MKSSTHLRNIPVKPRIAAVLVAACFASAGAYGNPVGPQVVSGGAVFSASGSVLNVTNTPNAIINWQGFSIGRDELTRFVQQSAQSAVLNRVVGMDPSVILGTLVSNGRVFLVNPAGILVGQGARVDVGGLVASTLNLSNSDFLAGKFNFAGNASAGSVVNAGNISTPTGGSVYLVAPNIENNGVINAPNGEVILAAGQSVLLGDTSAPGVKVQVSGDGTATNLGQILSQSGKVGIYGAVLRNKGSINADQVSRDERGNIVLRAKKDITLDATSVISAKGTTGDGGAVTVQAETGTLLVDGRIDVSSARAKGGAAQLLGTQVGVINNAVIDASGATGGGAVLVGGDYQGKNAEVQNASRTYVGVDTTIKANATDRGDGGRVIVWSDEATRVYGSISARGGATSGNGGLIETSGHWLDVEGARVNASAPAGTAGQWLLDPWDVIIDNTNQFSSYAGTLPVVFNSDGTNSPTSAASHVNAASIVTALSGGSSVSVSTSGSGTQNGDINVNTPVTWATPQTLTLSAARNININQSITASNASGKLELEYGQGSIAAGNTASYNVKAPINLQAGSNFKTKLGSDGSAVSYTVITALGTAGSINDGTLQGARGNVSGKYVLGADIDASATSGWNSGLGFTPIGANSDFSASDASAFSGVFDGLGHTIGNITINRAGNDSIGVFGKVSSAGTVRNLGIAGGTITGQSYIGGLAGFNWGAINNSYSSATVSGFYHVGGLVGVNEATGAIGNSYTSGTTNGVGTGATRIAGLVGGNTGLIANSYATGAVSANAQGVQLGGLVGLLSQNSSYPGVVPTVSNSYSTGTVSGPNGQYLGGLLGQIDKGSVSNSYATGAVSGVGSNWAGGLVGYIRTAAVITNSYANGAVSGGTNLGGLIGFAENGATVTNSYWNTTTSGQTSSAAGTGLAGFSGLSYWTGAAGNGLWSSSGNWGNAQLPSTNAIVVIDTGFAGIGYDNLSLSLATINASSPVTIQSGKSLTLNNGSAFNGALTVDGTLQIAGSTTVGSLNLSLGTLSGSGNLSVTNSFSQGSGTFGTGLQSVSINQGTGDLVFGGISAQQVTLQAGRSIVLNGNLTTSGPVVLAANQGGLGGGIKLNSASIASNGGSVTLGGGANPATTPAIGFDAAGAKGVLIYGGSINAGGGDITLNGTGYGGAQIPTRSAFTSQTERPLPPTVAGRFS